jgi:DNA-binding MarR family transcriptional regulator
MGSVKKTEKQAAAKKKLLALAEFRHRLRAFLRFSEVAAEEAGLRAQQYQLLQVVGAAPEDEPPTIAYVASRLFLRHNSAVELVDRTEQQGLLEREVDANDHRKILLRLTRRGEEVLASLVALHIEQLKQWGPEMIEVLRRVTGEANGAVAQTKPASRRLMEQSGGSGKAAAGKPLALAEVKR